MRPTLLSTLSLCAAIAIAGHANAQRRRPRSPDRNPAATSSSPPDAGYALTSRLGPAAALRLLTSQRKEDRLRGIERIQGQNDFAAAQILLRAISDNASIVADPTVKLRAVRALAPFASREPVRRVLASWVVGDGSRLRADAGLARDARLSAALALAASRDAHAIDQLVSLLVAGGEAADLAAQALQAHPPTNVEPLLQGRALASPAALRLLGLIGDLRALPALRKVLGDNDPAVASEAALALARLGDDAIAPIARRWLADPASSPSTRTAAAQALVLARAADAPRAVAELIADPATRQDGLELAGAAPTPQLTATLAGFLTIASGPSRDSAMASLARSGGPLAARTLDALAAQAPADPAPPLSLARCSSPSAREVTSRYLHTPATRLLGARMAITRMILLHDQPDDLEAVLRTMSSASTAAERQTAAFGLVAGRWESVSSFTSPKDPGLVAAACRATVALSADDRAVCTSLLDEKASTAIWAAAGAAFVDSSAARAMSTLLLLRGLDADPTSAPLFARLLGTRDSELVRPRLRQLLASGDPVMRAQVALGLATSPMPSSTSLLLSAFETEDAPSVRRAIIRALSHHSPALHASFFKEIATLDADTEVRSLAFLAARDVQLPVAVLGSDVFWVQVRPTVPGAEKGRSVRVVLPDGLALSTLAEDDGFLMLAGVPSQTVQVTVAPAEQHEQRVTP